MTLETNNNHLPENNKSHLEAYLESSQILTHLPFIQMIPEFRDFTIYPKDKIRRIAKNRLVVEENSEELKLEIETKLSLISSIKKYWDQNDIEELEIVYEELMAYYGDLPELKIEEDQNDKQPHESLVSTLYRNTDYQREDVDHFVSEIQLSNFAKTVLEHLIRFDPNILENENEFYEKLMVYVGNLSDPDVSMTLYLFSKYLKDSKLIQLSQTYDVTPKINDQGVVERESKKSDVRASILNHDGLLLNHIFLEGENEDESSEETKSQFLSLFKSNVKNRNISFLTIGESDTDLLVAGFNRRDGISDEEAYSLYSISKQKQTTPRPTKMATYKINNNLRHETSKDNCLVVIGRDKYAHMSTHYVMIADGLEISKIELNLFPRMGKIEFPTTGENLSYQYQWIEAGNLRSREIIKFSTQEFLKTDDETRERIYRQIYGKQPLELKSCQRLVVKSLLGKTKTAELVTDSNSISFSAINSDEVALPISFFMQTDYLDLVDVADVQVCSSVEGKEIYISRKKNCSKPLFEILQAIRLPKPKTYRFASVKNKGEEFERIIGAGKDVNDSEEKVWNYQEVLINNPQIFHSLDNSDGKKYLLFVDPNESVFEVFEI